MILYIYLPSVFWDTNFLKIFLWSMQKKSGKNFCQKLKMIFSFWDRDDFFKKPHSFCVRKSLLVWGFLEFWVIYFFENIFVIRTRKVFEIFCQNLKIIFSFWDNDFFLKTSQFLCEKIASGLMISWILGHLFFWKYFCDQNKKNISDFLSKIFLNFYFLR